MRLVMLLVLVCSCSNAWLDKRARTGHYSRDIYRDCMRARGADPDDWSARPKDDRACIQRADHVYSGDGEVLQAVGDGIKAAGETPSQQPTTADCTSTTHDGRTVHTHCTAR